MSGSALRWAIRMPLMLFQFVTLNHMRMPTEFLSQLGRRAPLCKAVQMALGCPVLVAA